MFGYVYKITLPNKYCYIGSHQATEFDENYWGSSENPKYWKALFTAGKTNVVREVLSWHETQEEMLQEEYRQINLHKRNCYNLSGYKVKNQNQKNKTVEKKKNLMLEKLNQAKAVYLEKLTEIDAEIDRVCNLSEDEILSENIKRGFYRVRQHSWNFGKTKESDERIQGIGVKNKAKAPWNKNKKYKELFGEEKAQCISDKISKNSYRISKYIEKENTEALP